MRAAVHQCAQEIVELCGKFAPNRFSTASHAHVGATIKRSRSDESRNAGQAEEIRNFRSACRAGLTIKRAPSMSPHAGDRRLLKVAAACLKRRLRNRFFLSWCAWKGTCTTQVPPLIPERMESPNAFAETNNELNDCPPFVGNRRDSSTSRGMTDSRQLGQRDARATQGYIVKSRPYFSLITGRGCSPGSGFDLSGQTTSFGFRL